MSGERTEIKKINVKWNFWKSKKGTLVNKKKEKEIKNKPKTIDTLTKMIFRFNSFLFNIWILIRIVYFSFLFRCFLLLNESINIEQSKFIIIIFYFFVIDMDLSNDDDGDDPVGLICQSGQNEEIKFMMMMMMIMMTIEKSSSESYMMMMEWFKD